MDVFDYIEKELDRIEVGYTSYDGTRLTMSIDDVRELLENLRMKLAQNLSNACTDTIYRQAAIDKFIDELDEIFANIRERHVDDSVCGLCEYDGAYLGQSGDWCNECPGFEKDDCFKLSGKIRKEWTDEIIKALLSAQPEPQWIPCSERLPDHPENDDYYLATIQCEHYDGWDDYVTGFAEWTKHGWDELSCYIGQIKVIAWMPLPEPYTERREE